MSLIYLYATQYRTKQTGAEAHTAATVKIALIYALTRKTDTII